MQNKKRVVFLLLVTAFVAVIISLPMRGEAETAKDQGSIAFLPFEVNAGKDITYLREGVRDMLASRLSSAVAVRVIAKKDIDKALGESGKVDQPALGKKLAADYLVTGSITAMGGSVSIDAKVFSVADQAVKESFFATAPREDDVIVAVDQLAWDIAEKIYGHARPQAKETSAPAGGQAVQSSYQTAHPERAFMTASGSTFGGAPIIRPSNVPGGAGFVKTQNFNMNMQAMDVGDVDGDGQNEIIMADRDEVRIMRMQENRLIQFWRLPLDNNRLKIHGVTVADIDKDGVSEIYVSAADAEEPSSFGVEWQGDKFVYLFRNVKWYVRALDMPGRGLSLLAQGREMNAPITPGIFYISVAGGEIKQEEKLPLPATVNLFDFSYGDIDGDSVAEVITINKHDRISVMRGNGTVVWESDEYYGGTTRFIGEYFYATRSHENNMATGMEGNKDRIYIPSRIIIADVNNDGIVDVVINKNLSSSSRVFENMKSYPSGEIHALVWNGIGLTELWRTRKIDGYIADYQLNLNKDKTGAELIVGLVISGRGLNAITSKTSTVLTYQLDFAAEKEQEAK